MKTIFLWMSSIVLVFCLSGCEDGGAENAGEKIDEAIEDTGNAIEDACEKAIKENC